MATYEILPDPYEALFRIQRALAGHLSYLAACDTNVVFSEYLLYEPILRILTRQGFDVKSEVPCREISRRGGRGDFKRLDFTAQKDAVHFALEVKWPREEVARIDASTDAEKLDSFARTTPNSRSFLLVFGRRTHIERTPIHPARFSDTLPPIYAMFIRTWFGCRALELDCQAERPPEVHRLFELSDRLALTPEQLSSISER